MKQDHRKYLPRDERGRCVALPPAEQFWLNVSAGDPKECWEWGGTRDPNGYGKFACRGWEPRQMLAHRASWRIEHGDPGDLLVCHTCDNPPCVNPAHLFLGTHADNHADMASKGRSPRGSKHWKSLLTEEAVRYIRRELVAGAKQADLAAEFGIGPSAISRIKSRHLWPHVEG